MLSRLLALALAALIMCGPAEARRRRKPPPPVPELPGEQPFDDTPLSYADDWQPSYVPTLIDIPATELVQRHHPTLEFTYLARRFGGATFSGFAQGEEKGPRFRLNVRAGRDLQVSAEAPYYSTDTPGFNPPGSFCAFSAEVKYLFPYEVAGFRSAIGYRYMFSEDETRPFFLPDDFARMNSFYAVISRTPSHFRRWHAMVQRVFTQQSTGDHTIFGVGVEQQLFRFKHNWVRAIGEFGKPSFEDPRLGALGTLQKAENLYANAALRVRSGILQVEAGTRRALQAGYDEGYVTVVKRF